MLQRLSGQDLLDAQDRTTVDPTRPFLVGVGPAEFSTSVSIEPWPSIIWDTNLFYRDMGVHRKASRVEIRKAYQEGGGMGNVRLTMIAGVLLNPKRRLVYDLVPLGAMFFDDEIEEAIRHRASTEASGVRADGGEVDKAALNEQIEALRQDPNVLAEIEAKREVYPWSYYLHQSECVDTDRLSEWRSIILEQLANIALDRPPRLGIGFMRSNNREECVRVAPIGYRMVILIDDQEAPSRELALQAAVQIIQQHTQMQQTQVNPNT